MAESAKTVDERAVVATFMQTKNALYSVVNFRKFVNKLLKIKLKLFTISLQNYSKI